MSSQVTQSKVKAFAVNNTMLFFAVILFAACMIGVPRFATGGNLMNILIQVSINALIACGIGRRQSTACRLSSGQFGVRSILKAGTRKNITRMWGMDTGCSRGKGIRHAP